MKFIKVMFALCAVLLIVSCAKPVPPERSSYVGEWKAPGMYLLILQDGSVQYQRLKSGASVSVNGPLKEFKGNDFVVGMGPLVTTFVVSKAPYQDGDTWKMVVDGVEVEKSKLVNVKIGG